LLELELEELLVLDVLEELELELEPEELEPSSPVPLQPAIVKAQSNKNVNRIISAPTAHEAESFSQELLLVSMVNGNRGGQLKSQSASQKRTLD
jgi:hypothetical protein